MRKLLVISLLACAGAPTLHAQALSDAAVGSKIVALENLWNQAVQAKDVDAMDRILDAGFVYVGADGRLLDKAEVMVDVRASGPVHLVAEAMVVHAHGETAVVTGIYTITGEERGHPFTRRQRFVDTWRHQGGTWVSIASLATPMP